MKSPIQDSPILEVCRGAKRWQNSPIQEREGGEMKVHWQRVSGVGEDVWSKTTDLARSGDEKRCSESVTEWVPLREGISS